MLWGKKGPFGGTKDKGPEEGACLVCLKDLKGPEGAAVENRGTRSERQAGWVGGPSPGGSGGHLKGFPFYSKPRTLGVSCIP